MSKAEWEKIISRAYRSLKPGGWLDWSEILIIAGSSNPCWMEWEKLSLKVESETKCCISVHQYLRSILQETGFCEVQSSERNLFEGYRECYQDIDVEGRILRLLHTIGKPLDYIRSLSARMTKELNGDKPPPVKE